MRYFLSILILLITLNYAKGQYFDTGQDPASMRWKQINTENFQIIYPEDFEIQAQRVAFIFTEIYDYASKTLNHKPGKVSVVLHTHTVKSNGLVAWAPKRIEFFTTPHQQTYSQDWLEQLAIHEFRHLVQVDKIERELPGILKIIFGEQAAAMVVGAYIPFWLLEGDAVVTETSLSHSGRGRLPSFLMEYEALLCEKEPYSFDKAYLGSYKDFVPNHYKMGYLMVGKIREKYGSDIWKNMYEHVARKPLSLTPVARSMKDQTGNNMKNLYNKTFSGLANEWKEQIINEEYQLQKQISPENKYYSNYIYGGCVSDSLIFAYRTSMDDISRFVLIDKDQNEKVIYTPGNIFLESVSTKGEWIIWSENRPDIRWSHSDRSVIRIFNIQSGENKKIRSANKLFSPAISPDEKTFVAVEVDNQNNHFLSIYDINGGHAVSRISTEDNQYFYTPCWSNDGKIIYTVCLSEKGKYLASYNIETQEWTPLIEPTFGDIKNPFYADGLLYFIGSYDGTDNLYTMNLATSEIYQVANVPFGANYPFIGKNGREIFFSNYTSGGYEIVGLEETDTSSWVSEKKLSLKANSLADNLADQESGVPNLQKKEFKEFETKKYSKLSHLVNIHSWAPAYIDINNYDVRTGFSVLSQNKLGTAQSSVGYDYNANDKAGKFIAEFNYSGWFPEINLQVTRGKEAAQTYILESTTNALGRIVSTDTILKQYTWDDLTLGADVRLPLNLSAGKYYRWFMPEVRYEFKNRSHNQTTPTGLSSLMYHSMSYRLYLYNLIHMSERDIYPEWGQQLEIIYKNTPFKGDNLGSIVGFQSYLYFPGFLNNHGFRMYQSFQKKEYVGNYSFSNIVKMPRGYPSFQAQRIYSSGIDYKFPIAYPDISIGSFAYIKRIKATLFYDYASVNVPLVNEWFEIINSDNIEFESIGFELTTDLHLFRFFAPFDLGFRTVYRKSYQNMSYEVLLSVDFSGL